MHGMIYEGLWRDIFVQPNHEHGRLVTHDAQAKTITLQVYRTAAPIHWPEAAPILTTIKYGDDTQFFVENDEADIEQVLNQSGSYHAGVPGAAAVNHGRNHRWKIR